MCVCVRVYSYIIDIYAAVVEYVRRASVAATVAWPALASRAAYTRTAHVYKSRPLPNRTGGGGRALARTIKTAEAGKGSRESRPAVSFLPYVSADPAASALARHQTSVIAYPPPPPVAARAHAATRYLTRARSSRRSIWRWCAGAPFDFAPRIVHTARAITMTEPTAAAGLEVFFSNFATFLPRNSSSSPPPLPLKSNARRLAVVLPIFSSV